MVDGLATIWTGIEDHPVAVRQPLGLGNSANRGQQCAREFGFRGRQCGNIGVVGSWDSKHMRRSLRVEVSEHHDLIVGIHNSGRDIPASDGAEEAVTHWLSLARSSCQLESIFRWRQRPRRAQQSRLCSHA